MTNTLSKDELMVSIYGVWHLWKERCRRVFQHTDIPERQLMELSRMISCFLVHIYRTHKEMKSMRQAMSLTFGSSPLPFLGRLMVMEGQILCRSAMQPKLPAALISNPLIKSGQLGTAFLGTMSKYRNITRLVSPISQSSAKNFGPIFSSFSSSFDGDGYKAGNFNDKDENYVNSTVMEAVEVRSGSDGYIIKMRDGKNLQCVHNNNSQGRHIPESAPQPAIVLRIEDGSETLLPIIVLEMPSVLLMAAIRNVHIARPTIYQVVKELIDKMGYEVKLVRVNKRIQEAYCAEMYLTKIGNQTECITFDLRPSDAINIAVRCKVPIQVHKSLAYNDGIRSVEPAKLVAASDGLLFTELDRPGGQPCIEAQEFSLVRNMLIAVIEERYKDAATWKDKLMKLRYKRKNWA